MQKFRVSLALQSSNVAYLVPEAGFMRASRIFLLYALVFVSISPTTPLDASWIKNNAIVENHRIIEGAYGSAPLVKSPFQIAHELALSLPPKENCPSTTAKISGTISAMPLAQVASEKAVISDAFFVAGSTVEILALSKN